MILAGCVLFLLAACATDGEPVRYECTGPSPKDLCWRVEPTR